MAPQVHPQTFFQLPNSSTSYSPRHFAPKPPSLADSDSDDTHSQPDSVIFSALCMFDFTSREAGQLSFRKNEILDIVKCTEGWWAATRRGESVLGWIPHTFVNRLTPEMAERLGDIREELRSAEFKRIKELHHSAENTTSSSAVGDRSARSAPLSPIPENMDLTNVRLSFNSHLAFLTPLSHTMIAPFLISARDKKTQSFHLNLFPVLEYHP